MQIQMTEIKSNKTQKMSCTFWPRFYFVLGFVKKKEKTLQRNDQLSFGLYWAKQLCSRT